MDFDINFINSGVNQELDKYCNLYNDSKNILETIRVHLDLLIMKGEKNKKNNFVKIHETDKFGFSLQCTSRRGKILLNEIGNIDYDEQLSFVNSDVNIEYFKFPMKVDLIPSTGSNINIVNGKITETCNNITKSKQKMKDMINYVYTDFINELQQYQSHITNINKFISSLDVLQNMCYITKKYNYYKPTIKSGNKSYIKAKEIRHPLIEQLNTEELYVTNDIEIGVDKDLMLLYGTNAVGKTSIIRALGINLIMAQAGLYVPSESFEYVPYKAIFTRILGNDNLFKGLSTFAVEMSELRVILKLADENSLILGDELCSGTEHDSAVSIFVSGLDMLHKRKASAIFATHLHEIVDFNIIKEMNKLDIKHMTVSYNKEEDILVYDRKLKEGPGESMYGLEVCKSLHLPDEFLEKAYEIRNKYKNTEGILSKKQSHFNNKKIMVNCELCKEKIGSEVHHLEHQEKANKNNMIKYFHKNHPANLLTLCEECHLKIHKTGKQHKKVKTSKGLKLKELEE
jgi:DNA mismatch repair protein MutS